MENFSRLSECFDLLKEKKMHIAFAESCTGGLCAKALTDLAGASEVIEASLVSYSNRIKKEKLGVAAETIEKYTEVSAECAKEMARGVRRFAGSDIGVSTTGYAGPTGKDVGLVYVCVSSAFAEKVNMKIPQLRKICSQMRTKLSSIHLTKEKIFDIIII